jgi:hypothetical protein
VKRLRCRNRWTFVQIKGRDSDWHAVTRAALLAVLIPPILGKFVTWDFPGSDGKKAKWEDWVAWFALAEIGAQAQEVPGLGQVFNALEQHFIHGHPYELNMIPMFTETKSVVQAGEDLERAVAHAFGKDYRHKVSHDWIVHAADAVGLLTGRPWHQPASSTQVLVDMKHPNPSRGRVEHPVQSVLFGTSREHSKKH